MKKDYCPAPLLLAPAAFPKEIQLLFEPMARNVHETWAAGRLRDGWRYGEKQDDTALKHPSLVPYDKLSDEEREYDRRTVRATLSVLIKSGLVIAKPGDKGYDGLRMPD